MQEEMNNKAGLDLQRSPSSNPFQGLTLEELEAIQEIIEAEKALTVAQSQLGLRFDEPQDVAHLQPQRSLPPAQPQKRFTLGDRVDPIWFAGLGVLVMGLFSVTGMAIVANSTGGAQAERLAIRQQAAIEAQLAQQQAAMEAIAKRRSTQICVLALVCPKPEQNSIPVTPGEVVPPPGYPYSGE